MKMCFWKCIVRGNHSGLYELLFENGECENKAGSCVHTLVDIGRLQIRYQPIIASNLISHRAGIFHDLDRVVTNGVEKRKGKFAVGTPKQTYFIRPI